MKRNYSLLRKQKIPTFENCFSAHSIDEGLSVRPSCRYEKFTQKVEIPITSSVGVNNDDVKASSSSSVSSPLDVEVNVILDIAHNEDAMKALVIRFKADYKDRTVRYARPASLYCLH
jgi:folylpolyglutamate synthase/dihydropteroate synthase